MRTKRRKPAIMVVGAPNQCSLSNRIGTNGTARMQRKWKKKFMIRRDRGDARVLYLGRPGEEIRAEDLRQAEKTIARCSAVLLLQDVVVGVALQTAALANKYHVKVLIDSEPMLSLNDKIKRVAEQLTVMSMNDKKHTSAKKWRKRRNIA
ncbi:hypothetical protein ACFP7A_03785 [Sporolactobacillus kofuensis]|uniref:Uncharacterized protein n=1 Tax=Sporolactobacillus kofuensis TaxID=269672 RepID=A0ABW1WF51_9BACL|nr:hypothetical protein [Sporolactobacillus kofuensis]MCO7175035.1 hypothetical protein [Sporolactobacillus kofuensis]